jgi:hypothetical protein
MKVTQDVLQNPLTPQQIETWVSEAAKFHLTHIAISVPYDSVPGTDADRYAQAWIDTIRRHGLCVWHRRKPLAWEGMGVKKAQRPDMYLPFIAEYIRNHKDYFAECDIFTPIPEPQNGGIEGINTCYQNVCQFKKTTDWHAAAPFNQWLREAISVSRAAFAQIGLNTVKIGYYGFDGYIAAGIANPDWNGIIEDETIAAMGNIITIDHYQYATCTRMADDLTQIETRYPGVKIVIGEWGTIPNIGNCPNFRDDPVAEVSETMTAFERPSVIGVNYWHGGWGGREALWDAQFRHSGHYDAVFAFFDRNR